MLNNQPLTATLARESGNSLTPERGFSILSVLRGSWGLACLGGLLSLAIALFTALKYGDKQEFTGSILYSPVPSNEASKHLLPATDLKALSSIVKSPQRLQEVIDHCHLSLSAEALGELIETKVPVNSQTILVSLRWREQGDGAAVLNRVMASLTASIGELRGNKVNENATAFQSALASCDLRFLRAREELSSFFKQHGVLDLTHETRMLTADLDALAQARSLARRTEANAAAQLILLDKTLDKLTGEVSGFGPNSGDPTPSPLVGKRHVNPARLQYLIQEERQLQQSEAQLLLKRKEYDRLVELARQKVVPAAELERLASEISTLDAQVRGNQKIKQWKQELVDFDQSTDAPLLQQAFTKKLDLDLQLLSSRNEQELLAGEEKTKRGQLDRLLKLQIEAAPLTQQVERLESERQKLQTHLEQLQLLRGLTSSEAVIFQAANPVPRSFATTRRWLIPLAAFFGSLLCCGGLLTFRHARLQAKTWEHMARRMGLPVLAHIPSHDQTPGNVGSSVAEVRSFALSLRQRLPQPGSTVLFSPARSGTLPRDLLEKTAISLAERDERVLILQAVLPSTENTGGPDSHRRSSDPQPGLANYLSFEVDEAEDVIHSTSALGVDLLPAGNVFLSPDALATHRMRELLEQLRHTYSIILVEGPPLSAVTDLQILAAYQNGVVLVFDPRSLISAEEVGALRSHLQLGVPLLGCVTVNG